MAGRAPGAPAVDGRIGSVAAERPARGAARCDRSVAGWCGTKAHSTTTNNWCPSRVAAAVPPPRLPSGREPARGVRRGPRLRDVLAAGRRLPDATGRQRQPRRLFRLARAHRTASNRFVAAARGRADPGRRVDGGGRRGSALETYRFADVGAFAWYLKAVGPLHEDWATSRSTRTGTLSSGSMHGCARECRSRSVNAGCSCGRTAPRANGVGTARAASRRRPSVPPLHPPSGTLRCRSPLFVGEGFGFGHAFGFVQRLQDRFDGQRSVAGDHLCNLAPWPTLVRREPRSR